MDLHTEAIGAALAPGIALNSVIFYNTSLQSRLTYIAGRIRDLNRETRELRLAGTDESDERLRSVISQVDFMAHRSRTISRAILIAYGALGSLIFTILGLLVAAVSGMQALYAAPLLTFGLGLCALGLAVYHSWSESRLSTVTLLDDIRSSRVAHRAPVRDPREVG